MLVFTIQQVLCVLGCVVGALCVSEYEGNYVDNYDNEISQDQQEGESRLFILLLLFISSLFEQMAHRRKIVSLIDLSTLIKMFFLKT